MRRPLRDDAALVHDEHAFSQRHHFFAAVRDIQNRDAMRLIPTPQIVDDLRLGGCVESRERFVEQKQQGSVTRDRARATRCRSPPEISAGRRWRKVIDVQLLQHLGDALLAGGAREMRETILGVLLDREMRKQCEILQDISHAAFGDWKILARVRVKQKPIANVNSTRVRRGQSGYAIEQRSFTGPRRAEKNGKSGGGAELHVE